MKRSTLLLLLIFMSQVLGADDLSFAFEGDASKRARLASLQGSESPPKLELSNWQNSDPVNLEDLIGKVVVLDFWATWCGPCIASIPHNKEIVQKYGDDVVFIGVCHPEGAEKMEEIAKSKAIDYPIAVDKEGRTIKSYKVNGYPDYYVFDQTGKLVVADCSNKKVGDVLDKLLNKK